MTEMEYNKKVKSAAEAYICRVITYGEWYDYMAKLIKEKENSFICG